MDGCVSSFEAYKLYAHAVRFSSSDSVESVEGEFRFTLYSLCDLVFVQGKTFIVEKGGKIAFYYWGLSQHFPLREPHPYSVSFPQHVSPVIDMVSGIFLENFSFTSELPKPSYLRSRDWRNVETLDRESSHIK